MRTTALTKSATRQARALAPQANPEVTPELAGEIFSKREFLAENKGKQPVSAEPSEARGANKSTPRRQPALAAKTPNVPWTLPESTNVNS